MNCKNILLKPHIKNLFFLLLLLNISVNNIISDTLVYSRTSDTEPWTPYIKELITEALKAQEPFQDYILKPSKEIMVQKRAMERLRAGNEINIFWTMTSQEREQNIFVLRIPLLRGCLGKRLIVIRKNDKWKFNSFKTLNDFKKISFGQGHDWPDADILENAGLKVIRSIAYIHENLMKMLDSGRFDALPLGMIEIWEEVAKRPQFALMVSPDIILSYNAPVFIFLNPSEKVLQEKLEKGFDKIIKNGVFGKIFNKHYQDIIQKADLQNKIIIKIENPYMSEESRNAMNNYSSILIIK